MKHPTLGAIAAITLAMCGGCATRQANETKPVEISGQWTINAIVVNDSLTINPSAIDPEAESYFVFDNGSYNVVTNCNTLSGSYTLDADSIAFTLGPATLMACPDMSVEDAIGPMLPNINSVVVTSDSTILLNTPNKASIKLTRMVLNNKQ